MYTVSYFLNSIKKVILVHVNIAYTYSNGVLVYKLGVG